MDNDRNVKRNAPLSKYRNRKLSGDVKYKIEHLFLDIRMDVSHNPHFPASFLYFFLSLSTSPRTDGTGGLQTCYWYWNDCKHSLVQLSWSHVNAVCRQFCRNTRRTELTRECFFIQSVDIFPLLHFFFPPSRFPSPWSHPFMKFPCYIGLLFVGNSLLPVAYTVVPNLHLFSTD